MDENELFERWKLSPPESRSQVEAELIKHLRYHAGAVCAIKLGRAEPWIANLAVYEALRQMHKFQGRSKFSTWFEAIVRNMCNRALAEKITQREREVPLEDVADTAYIEPDTSAVELRQIYGKLNATEREFVEMKFRGLSDMEIAERLGLPPPRVRIEWFRIRRRILRRLDGETEEVHAGGQTAS